MSVMAKKPKKNTLSRPRAIPVACAERKVYFRKGAGPPETDTLCHDVLFKLLFILWLLPCCHHKILYVRTEPTILEIIYCLTKGKHLNNEDCECV